MHFCILLLQQRLSAPFTLIPKNTPEIIKEASKSPLGILSLMVIILGSLAATFFSRAPNRIRVGIYVLIFAGVVAYGYEISHVPHQVRQYAGYIIDAAVLKPVESAKVFLDLNGSPHLTYSDSVGAFYFKIERPEEAQDLRVDKDGYRPFDRRLGGDPSGISEQIRLERGDGPRSVHDSVQPRPTSDERTVSSGSVIFHTNSHPKRPETIVEVSVIDSSGTSFASFSGSLGKLDINSESTTALQVDSSYDWNKAKQATCKVRIDNPRGETTNDRWAFNYSINLVSSKGDKLKCSQLRADLNSSSNNDSPPVRVVTVH